MEEESLCFYDQNFLTQNQLTPENIIQYFSFSPFYDKGCLNEILKMQSQFANIDISHKLTTLPGIYYILEHHNTDLFIIAKKKNTDQKTATLKVYYCMYGYIYCAPTARAVSNSKAIDCLSYLNEALNKYEEIKSFDWLRGFQLRADEGNSESQADDVKFVFETLHDFEAKNK
ncbi:uncharacterized protein VICG_01253 [Vittaforma corneae ATCC 50505]|uniref:Mediator of RNA polymerase II transcription subunit 6 n=1 Tax=Vittaforma corneae (strain ATCC 50505) TaxID=993615 RepID=L2GM88_VITCO|nr:uncharacterized protein VICG_01253 [Vittaforma corneae ATCC 50505]ELA41749.1 hypothetical protein VICG_01253 [Vittaforma corneae ATCC 50505]